MPTQNAQEILNRTFFEIRARLLEVGATLDRFDRADGVVSDDPRRLQIQKAIALLNDTSGNRAEQLQLLFSQPYEPSWREKYQIASGAGPTARNGR